MNGVLSQVNDLVSFLVSITVSNKQDHQADTSSDSDVIEQIVQFAYVTIRNRANTKTAREVGAVSDIRRKTVVW